MDDLLATLWDIARTSGRKGDDVLPIAFPFHEFPRSTEFGRELKRLNAIACQRGDSDAIEEAAEDITKLRRLLAAEQAAANSLIAANHALHEKIDQLLAERDKTEGKP